MDLAHLLVAYPRATPFMQLVKGDLRLARGGSRVPLHRYRHQTEPNEAFPTGAGHCAFRGNESRVSILEKAPPSVASIASIPRAEVPMQKVWRLEKALQNAGLSPKARPRGKSRSEAIQP